MRSKEDIKRLEKYFGRFNSSLAGWITTECLIHHIRNCNACVSKALEYMNVSKVKKCGEDSGFCRIYYKSIDKTNKTLYCAQEDYPDQWIWYVCTQDGEPSHQLGFDLEIVK